MPSVIHIHRSSSPLFTWSFRTKAEDISRLMDPSYSSTQQRRSVSVYVDGHGDLHDPDHRHFPAILTPRSPKRHSAYSSTNYALWDEHTVDDEEVDEDDHPTCLYNHNSRRSLSTVSRNNSASSSSRTSSPPAYHYATYYTYSDISPPTSYDSDVNQSTSYTSPFEEKEKRPSRLSIKRKRSSSKEEPLDTPTPTARSLLPTTEEEDAPEAVVKDDSGERVPTCTQSLQRQWQALSLAFRFGVFRAQRRMKQRVH